MIVPDDSREHSYKFSFESRGQLCCHNVSRSILRVQTKNSSVLRHLSYLSWTTCAFFSLMEL
uniref:Uncharacterized protein n=1 Tax=Arundo donax TaxID=35708 RepID=A0A0A9DHR7_ARUDO